jgi:hypothetical protein
MCSHNHLCVEELVYGVKIELDELNRLWSNNELSCRKIKEHLLHKGIDLDTTKRELHALNKTIKTSLRSPKIKYPDQERIENVSVLF